MRVLLDTNLLISYLLPSTHPGTIVAVIERAIAGLYTLLLPEDLVAELKDRASSKPYLAQRIPPHRILALIETLRGIAEMVPPLAERFPAITRDPDDDYLLSCAMLAAADYLVAGDRDLLMLGDVEGLEIVTPVDFLELLVEGTD